MLLCRLLEALLLTCRILGLQVVRNSAGSHSRQVRAADLALAVVVIAVFLFVFTVFIVFALVFII